MATHPKARSEAWRVITGRRLVEGVVIRELECGHTQPQPGLATNPDCSSALAATAYCRVCAVDAVRPEPKPEPPPQAPPRQTLRTLAASVREVWQLSASRPWTQAELRLARLLRAIDEHECGARGDGHGEEVRQ